MRPSLTLLKKVLPQGHLIRAFLFKNQSIRQTFAKNTFWLSVSQIGGRALRAVIIVYAARTLGAGDLGVFSYGVTLAAFLTVFVDLGISPILLRETAKASGPQERAAILSTTFILKGILLLIGVGIILFVAPYVITLEKARGLMPIIALILVFDTLREFGFHLSRAMEKMEWEAGLYMLTNFGIVAAGFLFLWIQPNVVSFTLSYAVGTGVGMCATFYALRHNFENLFSHFRTRLIRPILRSAWPFAISSLLGMLMLNTDILIIGHLKGAEDVGFYSAAQRIIQLLYIVPAIFALSILPTLSRLAHANREKFALALERTITLCYLVAVPAAVGAITLGHQIIPFIYGSAYAPGVDSFRILGATLVTDFATIILANGLFVQDKQKYLVINGILGGVSNVIFDILLIPRFGITGSAWATLCAQLLSGVYLWVTMKRTSHFVVLAHMKNIILASAVMGVFALGVSLTPIPVIVNIAASALLYFFILHARNEQILKDFRAILRPNASAEPAPCESAAG